MTQFFKQEVWNTEKFLSLEPYEKNREVTTRTKKMRKVLKTTNTPQLLEVSVGKVTKPFSDYKKNALVCLDGNTRAMVWRDNPELRPDKVCVKIYELNEKEYADSVYYSFDNFGAAEKASDKATGFLRERKYVAKSNPIKKGQFNTFLKKACYYGHDSNGTYLQTSPLDVMLNHHWNELVYLDEYQDIFGKKVKNSCNIYAALLMVGKKYGVNNPRFKKLLDNYCSESSELNNQTEMDGVTYVFHKLYHDNVPIWGNNAYGVNKLPLFGKILHSFDSFMRKKNIPKNQKNKELKTDKEFLDFYKDYTK